MAEVITEGKSVKVILDKSNKKTKSMVVCSGYPNCTGENPKCHHLGIHYTNHDCGAGYCSHTDDNVECQKLTPEITSRLNDEF